MREFSWQGSDRRTRGGVHQLRCCKSTWRGLAWHAMPATAREDAPVARRMRPRPICPTIGHDSRLRSFIGPMVWNRYHLAPGSQFFRSRSQMSITLPPSAPAPPLTGTYIGQTPELQAGKATPRRPTEKEERGEAARAGRPQGDLSSSAEALSAADSCPGSSPDTVGSAEAVNAATRTWIEKAVIGLQLCPFASSPYLNDRVRYCVSAQRSSAGLREELRHELQLLWRQLWIVT
jgi:hypothetical protein